MAVIVIELLRTVDGRHLIRATFVVLSEEPGFGLVDLANMLPDLSPNIYGTILLCSSLIIHGVTLNSFPHVEDVLLYFIAFCIEAAMSLYKLTRYTLDHGPPELAIVKDRRLFRCKRADLLVLKILELFFLIL